MFHVLFTIFLENRPRQLSGSKNSESGSVSVSVSVSERSACASKHAIWMEYALTLAHKAKCEGEVPVGALVVKNNELISEGWNQPIQLHDPTAHAEIIAMRNAAKKLKNYRLTDCILYVTLEPCAMCVGAMIHARIAHLIFGTLDPKGGAVQSVSQLIHASYFNHKIEFEGGICADKCSAILKSFFSARRM